VRHHGRQPSFLLTGASGQIGGELAPLLAEHGRCLAPTSAELDLGQPAAIRELIRRARPDVIINAAAYTAVDRAESEPERAFAINADAPAVLAEEAARLGALLVHYSTDYVFDGGKGAPYVEDDPVAPLNVYGKSKARGEAAVAASGAEHIVVRTSWVYGPRGANFPRTMLRLARERTELRVVADQTGTPTSSIFLAAASRDLVVQWLEDPRSGPRWSGIYHLTAIGHTTWYDFARTLLDRDPRRVEQKATRVIPIATTEYPTPARRPMYSVLDCSRVTEAFGVRRTEWPAQLDEVLRRWTY
jgi:dTDP-4-dehydrorhamnose reductase